MSHIFTAEQTWLGGRYELAVELGPRCDERLASALNAVVNSSDLTGFFRHRDREPDVQRRVKARREMLDDYGHLLGVARLADDNRLACGVVAVREENGPDWLLVYIPMGALAEVYPEVGAYPFGNFVQDATPPHWQKLVDDWLVSLGKSIFNAVAFRLALIGHEVSGTCYADELATGGVPQERWIGYLWPKNGGLNWYAPTFFSPPYS